MKIIHQAQENDSATVQQPVENYIDLTELYMGLQSEHRNVFMIEIEGTIFFYRSLGRSEWKKIVQNEELSELERQDVVCEVCTLWPTNFNFEDCNAGLPDILCKKILENSFLDSVVSRKTVMNYYRNEMFDLENQITCVINEAFPQFDIEEIERWDIEKTTKYLSRAEWKLHNLRGLQFIDQTDQMESFYERMEQEPETYYEPEPEQAVPAERKETIRGGNKDDKLTPEKIAELKEFQRKYPEFADKGETILTEGMDGMADSFDELAPALRPGF